MVALRNALAWLIGPLLMVGSLCAPSAGAAVLNGFRLEDPLVPLAQIHSGGPPRDGIPAIDHPRFVTAEAATFLEPDSRVLGIVLDGQARAYPLAILNWHEVVNDRVGDRAIVVTYCPLCGTGVVYPATVEGRTLRFGVSGLLYNSDVLLYDRQTESLWSQLRHQAISGPLKGSRLTPLPATLTRWANWRGRYPQTEVLSTQTGYRRDYRRNPYGGYEQSLSLYFPVAFLSQQYHPKERVLGVEVNGVAKAYPFAELAKLGPSGELRDRVGGQPVTIRYDAASRSAELSDRQGNPLAAINSFWFAWFAFHPETLVYKAR